MSDIIKIRLYVHSGFVGADHEDIMEIEKSKWTAMTKKEQERFLKEQADEFLSNNIDYGAYVLDEGDYHE